MKCFFWTNELQCATVMLLKLLRGYLKMLCPFILLITSLQIFSGDKWLYDFIIYKFIYNFNWITQYNSTLTSTPSRDRNCYSLKLISRSPLWLGSNIVAFHPMRPRLIPDNINLCFVPVVKVISSIIIIQSYYIYIYMYILLWID